MIASHGEDVLSLSAGIALSALLMELGSECTLYIPMLLASHSFHEPSLYGLVVNFKACNIQL